MTKTVPAEKAKQGRTGRQVLLVLVCALILASLAWYGAEFYGDVISPETPQTIENGG